MNRTLIRCYHARSGQSGPGSNGNEGVLCIPQSSSITGTSASDCLVSFQDTHWRGWLLFCRNAVDILQLQLTGQGKIEGNRSVLDRWEITIGRFADKKRCFYTEIVRSISYILTLKKKF